MKKKLKFTKGYSECRKRLNNNAFYSRSCFNCEHYYQAVGDDEEMCQNESVLEYDMVYSNNTVYCLKWSPCNKRDTVLFRHKSGRNRLD